MRKKIIAANWKMNLTHRDVLPYLDAFLAKVGGVDHVEVVLIPAFTALPVLAEALTKVPAVQLGAQNMHWAQSGAFTGEVSPAMLQACSVRYVVLGHSERRVLFGETDEGVEAWRRSRTDEVKHKVTEATFTFVAVDESRKPRLVPPARSPG